MEKGSLAYRLSDRGIIRVFLFFLGFLVAANTIGLVATYVYNFTSAHTVINFFNLDHEKNLPTLFNVMLFLLSSFLFLLIWNADSQEQQPRGVWLFLSCLFLYLSMDEFGSIHERLCEPTSALVNGHGVFYFAWIIPYGVAIMLLAVWVLPFICRLGRPYCFWFLLSATTYITGAIGFEMLGGSCYESLHDTPNLIYGLLYTCEETLEMLGLIILIHALLILLISKTSSLVLLFDERHKLV